MQRVRRYVSAVIVAVMMVTLAYGLLRFPDAPIHPCQAHGYCGKQGQAHSQKDFAAFHLWERAILLMWPSGMLALYVLKKLSDRADYEKVRATYKTEDSDSDPVA